MNTVLLLLSVATTAFVLHCSETQALGEGELCVSPLDCKPGLICGPGLNGTKRVCTADLTGSGALPPANDASVVGDTAPIPIEGDASAPSDAEPADASIVDAAVPDSAPTVDAGPDASDGG